MHEGGTGARGEVVARPAAATERLLEPIKEKTRVRASSTYPGEPSVGAQLAFDGDPASFWAPRRATAPDPAAALAAPPHAHVPRRGGATRDGRGTGARGLRARRTTREVDLTRGTATFAPLPTRRLVIRFDAPATVGSPPSAWPSSSWTTWRARSTGSTGDLATGAVCGLGPELEVDGRVYPTSVTGTLGAVLDGTPLTVTRLSGPVAL